MSSGGWAGGYFAAVIFLYGGLAFLLGFLGKTAFGCGVFVDNLWWIVWQRWIAGCRFWGGEFFAGFCGNLEIIFGLVDEEQATTTAKAIDQSLRLRLRSSLRQSGGRFAAEFRRGAEAPLYLRGNGNSKCNGWLGEVPTFPP